MSLYNNSLNTHRAFVPAARIPFFKALSTTAGAKIPVEQPMGNGNPGSGLGYSPRQIWRRASPRARFWIVAGLGVATIAESFFWINFGPRVLASIRGEKKE